MKNDRQRATGPDDGLAALTEKKVPTKLRTGEKCIRGGNKEVG